MLVVARCCSLMFCLSNARCSIYICVLGCYVFGVYGLSLYVLFVVFCVLFVVCGCCLSCVVCWLLVSVRFRLRVVGLLWFIVCCSLFFTLSV